MQDVSSSTLTITINVAPHRRVALLKVIADFNTGVDNSDNVDLMGVRKDYGQLVREALADDATSAVLRRRLIEDDARDAIDALSDADTLYTVQTKRFSERAKKGGIAVPEADTPAGAGSAALHRLYAVAGGQSGQSRLIACFLLGLFNGRRFPFDLSDLRSLDETLYEDCMRVLTMDARHFKREVHAYFPQGARKWERMAEQWSVLDVHKLKIAARSLAEQVGSKGPHAQAAADLAEMVGAAALPA